MGEITCRSCGGHVGHLVLDLGEQPACDYFPWHDDLGPDPVNPLQMWLCSGCGLAQLVADPTVPEEAKGAEPAALVLQAADAIDRVAAAGWLPAGARVSEYGSPHGGSWLGLLTKRGLSAVDSNEPADVVLDCFGLMHCADQGAALAERAARVAEGGVLLLQYHSLATIIQRGQWNALRHGHFAYYSTPALARMLAGIGFAPRTAWRFDLYGGTVLLAATRAKGAGADSSVESLLAEERALGVEDPAVLDVLQRCATTSAKTLHRWLVEARVAGQKVLGYGAASRAVALLCRARVDAELLPAVADASPAKQGRRMPGTDIPVIGPEGLIAASPDVVLLFLPDLLNEVRATMPVVEAAGGRWVDAEHLTSGEMINAEG
jgi:hypothetical protein